MPRKKSATKKAQEAVKKDESSAAVAAAEPIPKPKKEVAADVDSESESSSSEEEDEFGELVTENVEEGINRVLEALKSDPKKLLDPEAKFFDDPEKEQTVKKAIQDKPIYLKDYHRMNLLSGDYKNDENDNEYGTVDGEKPFVVTEREERNQLLSDINNAFNDEDDEEEDFLQKKEITRADLIAQASKALPDPEKDQHAFLSAFLDNQAWIPKKNDKVIDLDRIDNDAENDFDDAVEKFEHAYNFRYEDENAAEIVSYARNQATLRRSATNTRKRQREKKQEEKEQEEKAKQDLLKKKKTAKLNKVMDRLTKIKEAVGDDISDEVIQRVFGDSLLNDDFDDADWDSKMADIFNEQYYGAEDAKPEWDDEIMEGFEKDGEDENDENDEDEGAEEHGDIPEEEDLGKDLGDEGEPPLKKTKKDKLKDKKAAKKQKETFREKAQQLIENNAHVLMDEVEEERGRSKDQELKFKYREVSPESFGLTTRDIILADDNQLNSFIGIKKFAPYRAKELRMKDKRKYTKKKHLQDWKKEVFRNKEGPKRQANEGEGEIWIPMEEDGKKAKAKRDKGDKKVKKAKTEKREKREKKAKA